MDKSDPRRRLADDARRTTGLMASVIADADRAGADVPDGVTASVTVWRAWADRLAVWAAGGEAR
ncbi:MAG: hypothetical protein ACJ77H_09980 [Actinomycetota bacterium]